MLTVSRLSSMLTLILSIIRTIESQVTSEPLPTNFFLDSDSISVCTFAHYGCAIQEQTGVEIGGRAVCWGHDEFEFGLLQPPKDEIFVQLVCTEIFACGITLDQSVVCWGNLPQGKSSPGGLFSQIAGSRYFACGVMTDGKINCWGFYAPQDFQQLNHNFVQVSCSEVHCCGLNIYGHAICWGNNYFNQTHTPIIEISASGEEVVQLEPDDDENYEDDDETDVSEKTTFKEVIFKSVSVGSMSCGIRYKDSALQCWGHTKASPELRNLPGPFRQITTGHHGTCAILEDDRAICWGLVAGQVNSVNRTC